MKQKYMFLKKGTTLSATGDALCEQELTNLTDIVVESSCKIENEYLFFVAKIRPLDLSASSTDIMTNNLLLGFKQCKKRVVFFAISEISEEAEKVREYYAPLCEKIIVLPSSFGYSPGKYKWLFKAIFHNFSIRFYRSALIQVLSEYQDLKPNLIISHTPSFETICYSRLLHAAFPKAQYYQYYSDPGALSGLTPEKLHFKRIPFVAIERRDLKWADLAIYGTKPLMLFQRNLYPKYSEKMRYIDVAYTEKPVEQVSPKKNSLLYAGSYDSKYRNIAPLVDAVSRLPAFTLDIYGNGDYFPKQDFKNVRFHGRIPPDELARIEGQFETRVCVLNHSCIQIPGKVFYDQLNPCNILVISDGIYSELIQNYLEKYRRFTFCQNDVSSIMETLQDHLFTTRSDVYTRQHFSPKAVAKSLLQGGKKQ